MCYIKRHIMLLWLLSYILPLPLPSFRRVRQCPLSFEAQFICQTELKEGNFLYTNIFQLALMLFFCFLHTWIQPQYVHVCMYVCVCLCECTYFSSKYTHKVGSIQSLHASPYFFFLTVPEILNTCNNQPLRLH